MMTYLFLLFPLAAFASDVTVVATVPTLAAVAREIVGDHGKVTSLSTHTQDPHFVDPRPSLVLEVARADLLLLTGLDLEIGWLPVLLTGSRNAKIQPGSIGYLDCSQSVRVLGVPTAAVDRSMGDIHAGGNPHYHADPRAMRSLAPAIAARLSAIDPEHAAIYSANAATFVAALDEKMPVWEAKAAVLRRVEVIDFHRSWPYVEDWLGFHILADIEPKPGIPPTPRHILDVIQLASQNNVRIVLQESWFPSNTAQVVASKIGATLVVLDAMADDRGGQSYIAHIDGLVQSLVGAVR